MNLLVQRDRIVRKELQTRAKIALTQTNFQRKLAVSQQRKARELRKAEERQFLLNFTQSKNVIEKQMFRGKSVRQNRKIQAINKHKAKIVKIFKEEPTMY